MKLEIDAKRPWQNETSTLDCDKIGSRIKIIRSLIEHAQSDLRLAEITASEDSLWHLAEDCRNMRIAIEKLTSSKLEGE